MFQSLKVLYLFFISSSFCLLYQIDKINLPSSISTSDVCIERNQSLLFVGCINSKIYAINITNNKIIWEYLTVSPVDIEDD